MSGRNKTRLLRTYETVEISALEDLSGIHG